MSSDQDSVPKLYFYCRAAGVSLKELKLLICVVAGGERSVTVGFRPSMCPPLILS